MAETKTIRITQEHLDKAIAAPRDRVGNCLVVQAARDAFPDEDPNKICAAGLHIGLNDHETLWRSEKLAPLINAFDAKLYDELRAKLPVEIELSEQ